MTLRKLRTMLSSWDETFMLLFERCLQLERARQFSWAESYTQDELDFLASIGCKPREFYDYVEDYAAEGVPKPSTALLIAAVRRDYFLVVQDGKLQERVLGRDELPNFGEELGGYAYLPRILVKAQAKLEGTLDPDLMYGCGGDRAFLARHGHIHPADFLRRVWASGGDTSKLLSWLDRLE